MAREAIIVGGPNGAGKSTFAGELLRRRELRFHNTDELAKAINPDNPAAAQIQAGRAFLRNVAESIERGEDVLIESTLSGRTFRRIMDDLRAAGYRISILFVFLDTPQDSINRVRHRVRRGGHDVPLSDLLRRFNRSKANFWNLYRPRANRWVLVYNQGEDRIRAATGEGRACTVDDDDLFALFMRGVEEQNNE